MHRIDSNGVQNDKASTLSIRMTAMICSISKKVPVSKNLIELACTTVFSKLVNSVSGMQHAKAWTCNVYTRLIAVVCSVWEASTSMLKIDSKGMQHCVEQVGVYTGLKAKAVVCSII